MSSVNDCQLHDADTNGINWSTNYLHGLFSCKIQQRHVWLTDKRAAFLPWLTDWLIESLLCWRQQHLTTWNPQKNTEHKSHAHNANESHRFPDLEHTKYHINWLNIHSQHNCYSAEYIYLLRIQCVLYVQLSACTCIQFVCFLYHQSDKNCWWDE